MQEKHGLRQNKFVVGVTGGSGSGKSAVSAYASELGYCIIDADRIAHDIILKGERAYFKITEAFSGVVDENGEIDRKKLGKAVFSSKENLCLLNEITHPEIINKIKDMIDDGLYIIDAPLLFECELDKLCDKTVAVTADRNTRIKRIAKRNGTDEEYAENIIKNQPDDEFYANKADCVIENNGDMESLRQETLKVFMEFINENN